MIRYLNFKTNSISSRAFLALSESLRDLKATMKRSSMLKGFPMHSTRSYPMIKQGAITDVS